MKLNLSTLGSQSSNKRKLMNWMLLGRHTILLLRFSLEAMGTNVIFGHLEFASISFCQEKCPLMEGIWKKFSERSQWESSKCQLIFLKIVKTF